VDDAATTNTSYKWSFAEKTSKADRNALAAARDEIHSATRAGGAGPGPSASSSAPRRTLGPTIGPTLPSASDLTLAREDAAEDAATERARARKRQRADERDRVEDMVGPKPVGREGAVEAKRARREADAAFRAGRDDGGAPEADERTLLGGGDDFRAACVPLLVAHALVLMCAVGAIGSRGEMRRASARRTSAGRGWRRATPSGLRARKCIGRRRRAQWTCCSSSRLLDSAPESGPNGLQYAWLMYACYASSASSPSSSSSSSAAAFAGAASFASSRLPTASRHAVSSVPSVSLAWATAARSAS
jgi:hypothetical protein